MITRQSAKSMIRSGVVVNKDYINSLKNADAVVDAIFDELEALKHNYEAQEIIIRDKTALIEAMTQPSACEGCKWLDDPFAFSTTCHDCSRSYFDAYSTKDKQ